MLSFIIRRLLRMVPQLFLISILAFVIIQLPPGDYLTEYLNRLRSTGATIDEAEVERFTQMYGLDRPMYMQYLKWIGGVVTELDFGYSFDWQKPVKEVIGGRMVLTFLVALFAWIVSWGIAIPIGIFAAVRPYSIADYFFTFIGFLGLAVPGFLLALVIMYVAFDSFGIRVGGLYSPEYQLEPWSVAKFKDLLQHIWVPVVLLAIVGTANIMRTMRATMLDELSKQYVTVARSKGLSQMQVLMKYPVRLAINPIISQTMYVLPWLFSGGIVIEVVLNLPTAGPAMYSSLMLQDMYLAGSYILIIGALTAFGGLISDILLAVVDPRIRFGAVEAS
jgi:peptide/nickel transport system permease protein